MTRKPKQEINQINRAKLVARAIEVFGDHQRAQNWLHHPSRHLGSKEPTLLVGNEAEMQQVMGLLAAIEDGAYL